jgi:DNA-binding transcriptional LysR family regulator
VYLSWLGDITKEFQKVYSKIEIELIHDYSSNLLKSVENHEIDACVISKREGNHKWILLYKDKLVAWVSENHKLAKKNSISIEQLKKEPFIATHVGEDTDYARIF